MQLHVATAVPRSCLHQLSAADVAPTPTLAMLLRAALLALVLACLAVSPASGNLFESFFGGQGGGGQQRQRRGRGGKPKGNDMKVELGLQLSDVYTGAERDAQLAACAAAAAMLLQHAT